jgi:energy-coupling factor transporter ATP-binding protein EcfA2
VALVGATGSGKTTVLRLLNRYAYHIFRGYTYCRPHGCRALFNAVCCMCIDRQLPLRSRALRKADPCGIRISGRPSALSSHATAAAVPRVSYALPEPGPVLYGASEDRRAVGPTRK